VRISKSLILLLVIALSASLALPAFAQDGGATFKAKCAGCHGPEGQGKVGPALKGTSLTADQIADLLTKGDDAKQDLKSAFSSLSADDAKFFGCVRLEPQVNSQFQKDTFRRAPRGAPFLCGDLSNLLPFRRLVVITGLSGLDDDHGPCGLHQTSCYNRAPFQHTVSGGLLISRARQPCAACSCARRPNKIRRSNDVLRPHTLRS
jgi:cytochrome c551/c552